VAGRSVRAEASEFATKSTNEGRALNLTDLIAKVRADEARRAQAHASRGAKPGSAESKANSGATTTNNPGRVTTMEQGTQTPRIKSQIPSSGDKPVDLPGGHWLRQLYQYRCPVCADEVDKVKAVVALACGHLLCEQQLTDENCSIIPPFRLESVRYKPTILVSHDESTFRSGEVSKFKWMYPGKEPLYSKGRQRSHAMSHAMFPSWIEPKDSNATSNLSFKLSLKTQSNTSEVSITVDSSEHVFDIAFKVIVLVIV
jgi:hypothetical protein